jgi:hypothetical protein
LEADSLATLSAPSLPHCVFTACKWSSPEVFCIDLNGDLISALADRYTSELKKGIIAEKLLNRTSMHIRTVICLSLLALIVFVKACNKSEHPVSNLAKETFFNAELTAPIENIRAYYSSHPKLKPIEGYTVYPPLSALHLEANGNTYQFAEHPVLHEQGFLEVAQGNELGNPQLLFYFKSFENAKKFYLNYFNRLPNISYSHPAINDGNSASTVAEEFVGKKKIALSVMLDSLPSGPGYQVRIVYIPKRG